MDSAKLRPFPRTVVWLSRGCEVASKRATSPLTRYGARIVLTDNLPARSGCTRRFPSGATCRREERVSTFENTAVQPRQRRDPELHAAPLDVSAAVAHAGRQRSPVDRRQHTTDDRSRAGAIRARSTG